MSTTIDERVVSMKFDNKNFEANVSKSLGTLDKLKKSLDFNGSVKGLDSINSSIKGINMNGLGDAVDGVKVKFSALEVMAVTALANITNSAINAAKTIVSEFGAIRMAKDGFQEYETQMDAIQTIYANTKNKGTTLDDINQSLAELNDYADKTIYNFAQMTNNIGRFTAAGVDLDISTKAIQGISNLAAMSGSTSAQASTAMYQLSQALSTGAVKLQDWNSVVNANMGGEQFQEAVKKTAREFGIAVDDMIETEGSFRESLKKGWFTADVLTATLNKLTIGGADKYLSELTNLTYDEVKAMRESATATDDVDSGLRSMAKSLSNGDEELEKNIYYWLDLSQTAEDSATKIRTFSQLIDTVKEGLGSGWARTWQLIIGDFEESKKVFTEIGDMINDLISKSADSRNIFLSSFLGKDDISSSFFKSFSSSTDSLIDKYGDLYSAISANEIPLNEIVKNIEQLGGTSSRYIEITEESWAKGENALNKAGISVETFEKQLYKIAQFDGIDIQKILGNTGSDLLSALKAGEISSEIIRETFASLGADSTAAFELTEKGYNKLIDEIKNGTKATENWEESLKSFAKDSGYDIDKLKGSSESIFKVFDTGEVPIQVLRNAMNNLGIDADKSLSLTSGSFNSLKKDIEKSGKTMDDLKANVKKVAEGYGYAADSIGINFIGAFQNGELPLKVLLTALEDFGIDGSKYLKLNADGWVNLKKEAEKGSKALNKAFDSLEGKTGRELLVDSIIISIENLKNVIATVKEAWANVFPKKTSTEMYNIIKRIHDFAESLVLSDSQLTKLKHNLEAFFKVLKSIKEGFNSFIYALSPLERVFNTIIDQIKKISESLLKDVKFDDFSKGFTGVFDKIHNSLEGFATWFEKLFNRPLIESIEDIDLFGTKIGDIFNNIKQTDIGEIFSSFGRKIKEFFKNIDISSLKEFASTLWTTISDAFVESLDDGSLKKIAQGGIIGAIAVALWQFIDDLGDHIGAIEGFTEAFENFKNLFGGMDTTFTTVFNNIGDAIDDFSDSARLNSLKQIALSILGIGLALQMIQSLDQDKIGQTFASLAIAIGMLELAFNGISNIIGKNIFTKGGIVGMIEGFLKSIAAAQSFKMVAQGLIYISGALLICSFAIEKLSNIDYDSLANGLTGFFGIIAGLGIFIKILSKSKADLISAGVGFIIFAGGVYIIAVALEKLAEVISGNQGDTILMAVTIISGLMLLLNGLSKTLSNCGTKLIKGGAGLIVAGMGFSTFAGGILILAFALERMNELDFQKMVESMFIIFGSIIAFSEMAKRTSGSSKDMLILSANLILFGAAIAAMSVGLSIISQYGTLDSVLIIAGVIAVLGECANRYGKSIGAMAGLSGVIALLGIALFALAPGLILLGSLSLEQIISALTSLAASLLTLGISSEALSKQIVPMLEMCGIIAALGVALLILAPALLMLSVIPWQGLAKGAAVLAGALILLGGTAIILSHFKVAAASLLAIAGSMTLLGIGIAALGAGILALSTAITMLVALGPALITFFAIAAAAFIVALNVFLKGIVTLIPTIAEAAVIAITAFAESLTKAIPAIQQITITLFRAILESIKTIIPETIETFLYFIEELLKSLANHIPEIVSQISKLIVDTINALAEYLPLFLDAISNLGVVLIKGVLQMIVDMFFKLVETFNDVLKNNLPDISDTITEAFHLIFDGIVEVATEIFSELGEALGTIVGKSLSGFMEGLSTGLESLGEGLSDFMNAGKDFFDGLKTITPEQVSAAKSLAEMMLIFAEAELVDAIPNIKSIFGDNYMVTFGKQLSEFAPYLVDFANSTSGINGKDVENAANAAKALVGFAKEIPNEGGAISKLVGDNTLASFAKELTDFTPSLVDFAESVSGVSGWDGVYTATDAAKALIGFAKDIPNEGGAISKLVGDNSLSKFASEMTDFGDNLVLFLESVSVLDESSITNCDYATQIGSKLVTFASNIGNQGGLLAKIVGDNTLSQFSAGLVPFGENIKAFVESVSGIDESGITTADSAVKIARSLANIGTMDIGKNDMKYFGQGLEDLGEALSKFCNSMMNVESLEQIRVATQNLVEPFFTTIQTKKAGEFVKLGQFIVEKIITGIGTKTQAARTQGKILGENISAGVKDNTEEFYSIGTNIIYGLINGLQDEDANKALAAASDAVANSIANKMRSALDVHSPSRVARQIGVYVGEGLILGLNDTEEAAGKAGYDVADAVGTGLSKAIESVTDFIQNGIDSTPTITPVLDLSNVEAGKKTLNTMFSRSQALAVGAVGKYEDTNGLLNDQAVSGSGTTIQYTQNNYSPKALSRSEIYRQTKNQLSSMKGALA